MPAPAISPNLTDRHRATQALTLAEEEGWIRFFRPIVDAEGPGFLVCLTDTVILRQSAQQALHGVAWLAAARAGAPGVRQVTYSPTMLVDPT